MKLDGYCMDDEMVKRARARRARYGANVVRIAMCGIVAVGAVVTSSACAPSDSRATPSSAGTANGVKAAVPRDTQPPPIVRVPEPDTVRGLYINRWAALGEKMWQHIDVARRTEVNTLVIDVKDDRGFVLYASRVPLAREIGADTNRPMSEKRFATVLDSMRAHGVYPIARIVVVKDPLLANKKLDWAIRRKDDPAKPWLDKNGQPWLDPTHREVWQYAIDLALEAYARGFSAVQFDYVRFPDEKRLVRETVFPLANGRTRAQIIRDQLGFTRDALEPSGMPMTIDVFGLTATDTTDMGIGQHWESFIDRADVVLPMVYPSHFAAGTYKLANPNARPYETIDHSVKDMKRRSAKIAGAAKIVPWYQDFTLGPPRYGVEQVRAQMRAGADNGIPDWILWNPGSRYTLGALREERPKSQ
jgi:hypothetical protein